MTYYKPLKYETRKDRRRIVKGLQRLRQQASEVRFPTKQATFSLILGTWNIRNFDDDRFDYGPRSTESFFYLAEILSWFDIVAVQELTEDLRPLERILKLLGGSYKYIVTDVTDSGLGGNKERLGFIYDSDKVKFRGVAGEIVLPEKELIGKDGKRQFSRTPFGVEFQAGWFKFVFSTVHIYFGSNSTGNSKYKRRVGEIEAIAKYVAREAKKSEANQIIVGDFNIIKPGSDGHSALTKHGFQCIRNRKGSNKDQTKFYDQISFLSRKDELKLVEQPQPADHDEELPDRVFQFFSAVYRDEDFGLYRPIVEASLKAKLKEAQMQRDEATSKTAKKKAERRIEQKEKAMASEDALREYYDDWRTFQMSDHLPLWVELEIDFSDAYLDYLHDYSPENP